jgi:hypothetical protein
VNDDFTLARITIRATSGSARLPEVFLVASAKFLMSANKPAVNAIFYI